MIPKPLPPGEVVWGAGGGAEGLRGASGAVVLVQLKGAVQVAVRGAAEPAWGVQGLTHGALQPAGGCAGCSEWGLAMARWHGENKIKLKHLRFSRPVDVPQA